MKAILDWFKQDTRWAWLLLALILGLFSDSFYCASLVGGTAIIAYVAGINKEWKLRGSYLICVLILVLAFAGYGLVELLTEK
jgi:hypothetical protein